MVDIRDALVNFVRSSEENYESTKLTLFRYLCKGFGISEGDTTKAVFLKSKLEGLMPTERTSQCEELYRVLSLMRQTIEIVTLEPDFDVEGFTKVDDLLDALEGLAHEASDVVLHLPDNFIGDAFHRAEATAPAIMPCSYYKDGALVEQIPPIQTRTTWEDTGVMVLHSWKVFNDFMQCHEIDDLGNRVVSGRTNAFGTLTKTKFSLEDMDDAFAVIKLSGGNISPNMIIALRKTPKALKTTKMVILGKPFTLKFNKSSVATSVYHDDTTGRNIRLVVVNLYGEV